jgi:hypothetical protein
VCVYVFVYGDSNKDLRKQSDLKQMRIQKLSFYFSSNGVCVKRL